MYLLNVLIEILYIISFLKIDKLNKFNYNIDIFEIKRYFISAMKEVYEIPGLRSLAIPETIGCHNFSHNWRRYLFAIKALN